MFAIRFVLSADRVSIIVPRIGIRWAEILEAPLMFFPSFITTRFIFRRWEPLGRMQNAIICIVALAFMLTAEIIFILARGLSMSEHLASRVFISGTVYLFSLYIFVAMPFLSFSKASRLTNRSSGHHNAPPLNSSDRQPLIQ